MYDSDDQTIQDQYLTELFGREIVDQARLVDAADLILDEKMTACISSGVTRLKQLRHYPAKQRELLDGMGPGEQLLLCMWVMEMDLLDKIRDISV
jgi:hypothetical protein